MENQNEQEQEKKEVEKNNQAGCLGIGISFLIPIVGIILYFSNKKKMSNAVAYLYAAFAGIGLVFIAQIFKAAAGAN